LANVWDLPRIQEIVRAAYSMYLPRIGKEPAPMSADYRRPVEAGNVYLAVMDRQVVGVIVLGVEPSRLLIENVAVEPAVQRAGIGSMLMELAEREARRVGVDELRLYTNQAMVENLSYYARRGYRETHRSVEDGYSRVYLSKRLLT
jgi:GNAT superfamily N-acetyltransferase